MEFITTICHEYPGYDAVYLKCGAVIHIGSATAPDQVDVSVYAKGEAERGGQPSAAVAFRADSGADRDRFQVAVERAEFAFWAQIARDYPECKSGDDTGYGAPFLAECRKAVDAWLVANLREAT